jgi:D-glycero-D-manno-heptose 1,7-bisphosphate phosphatase
MPGMLHSAAIEMGLDLARSILVGDKASDLAAAGAAGCRSVLVRTGHGGRVDTRTPDPKWNLTGVATDLGDAIRHLLPELVDLVLKRTA